MELATILITLMCLLLIAYIEYRSTPKYKAKFTELMLLILVSFIPFVNVILLVLVSVIAYRYKYKGDAR